MEQYLFVILHYNTADDTMECAASIEKVCGQADYHILIVDNGSPNGSGARLEALYAGDPHVTVLLSRENLGFARGNNIGFAYAKEHFHPDYIILLNNDTVLYQQDFLPIISRTYRARGYAVLGPMMLTADGRCDQNPLRCGPISRESVLQTIRAIKIRLFCARYHLLWTASLYKKFLKKPVVRPKPYLAQENVKLHGFCLIFSKPYIERFDGLDSRTFMYGEEDFLQKRLQDHRLLSLYCPELAVYHKEGGSTQHTYRNRRKKFLFFWENSLKSMEILLADFPAGPPAN